MGNRALAYLEQPRLQLSTHRVVDFYIDAFDASAAGKAPTKLRRECQCEGVVCETRWHLEETVCGCGAQKVMIEMAGRT
jgi:hypothetical protein